MITISLYERRDARLLSIFDRIIDLIGFYLIII
jgi:hypothetical protein